MRGYQEARAGSAGLSIQAWSGEGGQGSPEMGGHRGVTQRGPPREPNR